MYAAKEVKVRFKEELPALYLTVTAVLRGTVESNRKRIASPYDEKHDTARCCGEPARPVAKPKPQSGNLQRREG